MKKILLTLVCTLFFLASFAQSQFSGIILYVTDSSTYRASSTVTNAHSSGKSDIYWNAEATTPHYDWWNGASYSHGFGSGSGSSGWPLTGSATLTGDVVMNTDDNDITFRSTTGQSTKINIDGANNTQHGLKFQTGAVDRWTIHTDNNETGSGNTGSDFHIERFDDAGVFIDAPFGINRTDGVPFFENSIKITGGSPGAGKLLTSDADGDATWETKIVDAINNGTTSSAPTENAVFDALALKKDIANTASALTDGGSIDITGTKHTLTTDEATITFSQSYTGDFANIDVTFNTTSATWTFPAGSLCVVEGSASGNNTATVTGVSGDKIVISIWFVAASNYRIAIKNFGQ